MSRESKKRTKEWLGKSPDIVLSRDVITQQSAAGLSGVANHTAMLEGSSAVAYAGLAGKLDGAIFTISPPIASGIVTVSLSLGGAVVASGEFTAAGETSKQAFTYKAGDDSEQAVLDNEAIEAAYAISLAVGHDGQTGRQITARILVSYEE